MELWTCTITKQLLQGGAMAGGIIGEAGVFWELGFGRKKPMYI
jgi:hypothetical protein